MTVDDLIKDFVYTSNNISLDIEFVMKNLELEISNLLGQLDLYRIEMMRNGYSREEIENVVNAFIGRGKDVVKVSGVRPSYPIESARTLFAPFYNRQNRLIAELTKQMVAKPVEQFDKENPGLKYHWRLGSVKTSHCPDCKRMASISNNEGSKTVEEWRKYGVGLPREGGTACNAGCHCMLEPDHKQEVNENENN